MYNNTTSKMNEMSKYIVMSMTLLWNSKDEEEDDSTH